MNVCDFDPVTVTLWFWIPFASWECKKPFMSVFFAEFLILSLGVFLLPCWCFSAVEYTASSNPWCFIIFDWNVFFFALFAQLMKIFDFDPCWLSCGSESFLLFWNNINTLFGSCWVFMSWFSLSISLSLYSRWHQGFLQLWTTMKVWDVAVFIYSFPFNFFVAFL